MSILRGALVASVPVALLGVVVAVHEPDLQLESAPPPAIEVIEEDWLAQVSAEYARYGRPHSMGRRPRMRMKCVDLPKIGEKEKSHDIYRPSREHGAWHRLFVKQLRPYARMNRRPGAPVGQVVVLEAWSAGEPDADGDKLPDRQLTSYVMLKTGNGWLYGTIAADRTMKVESSCAGCHARAPHDGLHGIERLHDQSDARLDREPQSDHPPEDHG